MKIETNFDFGDDVIYVNKSGKDYGKVTGVSVRPTGIQYAVTWSDKKEVWHYEFEIQKANQ